jgi:hypothetical protein
MSLLVAIALAAPNELFPWSAPVDIPEAGVVRVGVPPALRSTSDPNDGSDLQLVDATGRVIPVAVVRGDTPGESVWGVRGTPDGTNELEWWPGAGDWQIEVRYRPIDALNVVLPTIPGAARVTIEEQSPTGWVPVAEQLVWRLADTSSSAIPMPPRTGRFRALIDPLGAELTGELRFDGVRGATALAEERIELPVTATLVMENGWVRYDVPLPRPLPVRHVELAPTEPLFDRQASAGPPPYRDAPDQVAPEHTPWNTRQIQRLNLGGARLESVRVPVEGQVGELLCIWVEASGRPPLEIPTVTVVLPRVELLVQDAGPGPFTLLAGAPMGTNWASDLQMAAAELDRLASSSVEPGPAQPNPAYVTPEDRGGLLEPSAVLDPGKFSVRWPILGPPGLVRVALPTEVLTTARPDLGDLRVVDDQNRQLPYLLRTDGVQHDLGALPMKRTERGRTSVIELTLPTSNLLIGTVTLTTSAPLFERQIRVSQPDRGKLVPLRAFTWTGGDRPAKVTLDVNHRLGDTLVVEIENGDDPPLPIETVSASWPGWEVVTRSPGVAYLWAGIRPSDAARLRSGPGGRRGRPRHRFGHAGPRGAPLGPAGLVLRSRAGAVRGGGDGARVVGAHGRARARHPAWAAEIGRRTRVRLARRTAVGSADVVRRTPRSARSGRSARVAGMTPGRAPNRVRRPRQVALTTLVLTACPRHSPPRSQHRRSSASPRSGFP